LGVPSDELGVFITKNPCIFKDDLDDLQVRVNYLQSKKFSAEMITRVVRRNPWWLSFRCSIDILSCATVFLIMVCTINMTLLVGIVHNCVQTPPPPQVFWKRDVSIIKYKRVPIHLVSLGRVVLFSILSIILGLSITLHMRNLILAVLVRWTSYKAAVSIFGY
jgi:hypothetical protein